MKYALALFAVVSIVSFATPSFAADEVLTNASIIEMKSLGLGDDVIIGKIKTSNCKFDTSITALKQLKDAKISDPIIQAMLLVLSPPSAPAAAPALGDPNDPAAVHDPGVYLYQEVGGKKTMTKIEPSHFGETKAGTPLFALYGASEKARAVMTPAYSDLQLTAQPIFYFYFEKTQSGLSDSSRSATGPQDFTLLNMEIHKNERRVVIGKVGLSSSSGFDPKQVRETAAEKVTTGVWKVTPKTELADGEYCFLYAGTSTVVGWGIASGPGKGFCFGMTTGLKAKK
jgi:hypothetical protein